MAYDAAFGTQGAQRIAPPANAGMIDSVISANNDGVAKEMLVTIGFDSGSDGKIAAGDYFEVQVTELLTNLTKQVPHGLKLQLRQRLKLLQSSYTL